MSKHRCTDHEVTIVQWLDGTLPQRDVDSVSEHVACCDRCAKTYRETKQLFALLRDDAVPEPTQERLDEIVTAALATGKPRDQHWGRWLAIAATVLLAVGASWWLFTARTAAPFSGASGSQVQLGETVDGQFYSQLGQLKELESQGRPSWGEREQNVERNAVTRIERLAQHVAETEWDGEDMVEDLVPEIDMLSAAELNRLETGLDRALKKYKRG